MSQAFKDHIWVELGLGYTIKQIYGKHKAIWWVKINVGEAMTRDDFIKQQDIAYLDRKHKKKELTSTQKRSFPFARGNLIIQMICLIFKMQVKLMGFVFHSQS
jgi:hypothetical protein